MKAIAFALALPALILIMALELSAPDASRIPYALPPPTPIRESMIKKAEQAISAQQNVKGILDRVIDRWETTPNRQKEIVIWVGYICEREAVESIKKLNDRERVVLQSTTQPFSEIFRRYLPSVRTVKTMPRDRLTQEYLKISRSLLSEANLPDAPQ